MSRTRILALAVMACFAPNVAQLVHAQGDLV